ncbi:VWA domain-containing protein [Roseofilum reptotaenium CS-1145]|uniref:VWFA domain-containing protein n=1 Tax=Roseofilum reptotaenium AO1-A TaxID=1925591 RepID=A0A1L9QTP3_9CYAN|nr:VWA domain-containing protein [Roseofilum reptotaenium]MDB9519029.1 VWA domain-containing protein [Roseofilum reptotaenium CS-1145]OJJ26033.1 hypothetical protein BI308_08735 [Roseofilum reptotaenium AO1-A]
MPVGKPEFVDNPEPRCPVVLLLDNSGSMSGRPIQELNSGLKTFKQAVEQDTLASLRVEIAIISFGPVVMRQDFVTIDQFSPPQLQAEELTPMGSAIEYALDILEDRKQTYKDNGIQYYRPWVFLVTDGSPTDDWENAANRVRQSEDEKKIMFFAVGVEDADMQTLAQIAPPGRPPVLLNGLDFKSMFEWLSASLERVSHSKPGGAQITLSAPGWGQVSS